MQKIEIIPVNSDKELNQFIEFNYELYKGNKYAVPELMMDMKETFNPEKNASYEFCEAQLYLAKKDGKVVGRVAAIINRRANETWNVKNVRFGWIDFIEDIEVCRALIDTVIAWGKERGMTDIQGPMGFIDFDREGMLTEGFDWLGTMSTFYNYPYYPQYLEQLGFEKEAEWMELHIPVPEVVPEKFMRIGELVRKRNNVHIKKMNGKEDLFKNGYGQKIFDVLNAAYSPLFGFSLLSQKQIDQIVKSYFPLLNMEMITLVETDDTNEVVCVGITMPSIARGLQKSRGKLFPFGWYHILKSLKWKYEDGVEMLLYAATPEWQGRGVVALLFTDLIPIYQRLGFKWAETNCILEDNYKSLSVWQYLEHSVPKRRRCYHKQISD